MEFRIGFLVFLMVLVLSTLIYTLVIENEPEPQTITFNVVGIESPINATSLVQIHLECIKYCIKNTNKDSRELCYTQCEKLGDYNCVSD